MCRSRVRVRRLVRAGWGRGRRTDVDILLVLVVVAVLEPVIVVRHGRARAQSGWPRRALLCAFSAMAFT